MHEMQKKEYPNIQVYSNFSKSLESNLFGTFDVLDILKLSNDVIEVYIKLLKSEHSIPLFNDIMSEAIFYYYRRLYDTTNDYFELYSQNIIELESDLYASGAYNEFMDFVYTVLDYNNLTFGYSDYSDSNRVAILNDAQLNIFERKLL